MFSFYELNSAQYRPCSCAVHYDVLWVELVRLLAVVCGAFILRGHDWARWVALAWMGFHVVVSAFHAWPQLAIHVLFLVVIAWFLCRPDAARYFRPPSR